MKCYVVILLFVFHYCMCDEYDEIPRADKKSWVDPGDMFNYDPSKKDIRSRDAGSEVKIVAPQIEEKRVFEAKIQPSSSNNAVVFYRRFVKLLLINLKHVGYRPTFGTILVDGEHDQFTWKDESEEVKKYIAHLHLTKKAYLALHKFASSASESYDLSDVDDSLSRLFSSVEAEDANNAVPAVDSSYFQWPTTFQLSDSAYLPVVMICAFLWLIGNPLTIVHTFKARLLVLLLFVFLQSMVMVRERLLQEKRAIKHFNMAKLSDVPVECTPEKMTTMQTVSSVFSTIFGYENRCLQYMKALHMQDELEVTPNKVLADTFMQVFDLVIENTAGLFGRSSHLFFSSLSLYTWIMMLISVLLVLVVHISFGGIFAPIKWFTGKRSTPSHKAIEDVDKNDIGNTALKYDHPVDNFSQCRNHVQTPICCKCHAKHPVDNFSQCRNHLQTSTCCKCHPNHAVQVLDCSTGSCEECSVDLYRRKSSISTCKCTQDLCQTETPEKLATEDCAETQFKRKRSPVAVYTEIRHVSVTTDVSVTTETSD